MQGQVQEAVACARSIHTQKRPYLIKCYTLSTLFYGWSVKKALQYFNQRVLQQINNSWC